MFKFKVLSVKEFACSLMDSLISKSLIKTWMTFL